VIATQHDIHAKYGGVFPELACRRHIDVVIPVIEQALNEAGVKPNQIDLIAVAKGPGLIGALLIGLNTAKTLSLAWNKPFIGVNHVEAHLYGAIMGQPTIELPALGMVISGGHTFLVQILALGNYRLIGTTVDDAIGEAFDKVGSLLGLPYPGGPLVEKLALSGNPTAYPLKAGRVKGRVWDFSFSGLKTSVLYAMKGQNGIKDGLSQLPDSEKPHIAASFQQAALSDIIEKLQRAISEFPAKAIYFGGGVSNNQRLRQMAATLSIPSYFPPPNLSLDNGAMIAGLGYQLFLNQNRSDPLDLEPMVRIPLEKL
jgi:N6-L-threonylcarbamoyladenine synthase